MAYMVSMMGAMKADKESMIWGRMVRIRSSCIWNSYGVNLSPLREKGGMEEYLSGHF
jgi:hypothetical protein